jgi:hypothetical protein
VKLIYSARHALDAQLVRGFLASHGVAAEVRGEYLTSGWGELPADVCSVWIAEDAQFEEADELLRAFLKGTYARRYGGEAWKCPSCGESLEGQFTECWRCAAQRPTTDAER